MKKTSVLFRVLLPLVLLLTLAVLVSGCSDKNKGKEQDTGNATQGPAASATESRTVELEPVTAGPNDIVCHNPDFEFEYTDEQYNTLNKKIDQLYAYLESGKPEDQEAFLKLYKEVEDGDYEDLMGQYMIITIQNSVYTTYPDIADTLASMSEKYNDALQRLIVMYDDIDESPYGEEFYKDWTAEEKELAIRMAKNYTDELVALRVEYDKLETEYKALADDAAYMQKSADIYLRAVELNKQIAKLSGYDNYMDYAYDMTYERDYTPADVAKMKEFVKTYIVPMLSPLLGRVNVLNMKLSDSPADYMSYNTYMNSSLDKLGVVPEMGEGSTSLKKTVDEYLTSIDPDMCTEYHNLFDNNHYIIAHNGDVSQSGAFTAFLYHKDYPMAYFGPGYQGLFTVIHEYGHAYAMQKSGTGDIPMDLAEVHSQGNEWLFCAYLKQKMPENAYEFLVDYKLFSDLASICNCLAVNEFEQYVYTHDITNSAAFDTIMENVLKELGIYDFFKKIYADPVSYWHYVCIDNPGYYISYAMSLVPSITIFSEASADFDKTADAYHSLAAVGEYDTFLGKLEAAGISSPFEEKTYTDLKAVYEELIK